MNAPHFRSDTPTDDRINAALLALPHGHGPTILMAQSLLAAYRTEALDTIRSYDDRKSAECLDHVERLRVALAENLEDLLADFAAVTGGVA